MADEGVDPAELRRRIVVCFSAAELRELAESLGTAEPIDFDRGVADAARDLVRSFEKGNALPALVARLREVRPLVEWPDLAHDRATSVGPADVESEPAAPDAAADPAPPPAAAPPASTPWVPPGHEPQKAEEAPRGVDPRILVAVSGLTLAAAIVAFVAGRASTPPSGDAGPSATAAPGAPARFRPDGPAGRASLVFERGLANVARACEVPADGTPTAELLRGAYEQCGPVKPPARPVVAIPPPRDPIPPTVDPDVADQRLPPPVPPPQPRPATGGDPDPAAPANAGCIGGCDGSHKRCKSGCGAEPTESSKYADYQSCLSKCLKEASKCRLTCQ